MLRKKCPDCMNRVSTPFDACPHCGYNFRSDRIQNASLIQLCGGALFLFSFGSSLFPNKLNGDLIPFWMGLMGLLIAGLGHGLERHERK